MKKITKLFVGKGLCNDKKSAIQFFNTKCSKRYFSFSHNSALKTIVSTKNPSNNTKTKKLHFGRDGTFSTLKMRNIKNIFSHKPMFAFSFLSK